MTKFSYKIQQQLLDKGCGPQFYIDILRFDKYQTGYTLDLIILHYWNNGEETAPWILADYNPVLAHNSSKEFALWFLRDYTIEYIPFALPHETTKGSFGTN